MFMQLRLVPNPRNLINLPHLDPQLSLYLYIHLLGAVFGKEDIDPKPNMISSDKKITCGAYL